MVEDEDIQLTINTFGANLETLAKQLVLLSNDNGGRDNVSIVLVRVLDNFPAQRGSSTGSSECSDRERRISMARLVLISTGKCSPNTT